MCNPSPRTESAPSVVTISMDEGDDDMTFSTPVTSVRVLDSVVRLCFFLSTLSDYALYPWDMTKNAPHAKGLTKVRGGGIINNTRRLRYAPGERCYCMKKFTDDRRASTAAEKPAMTEKQRKIAILCTVTGVFLLLIAVIALICNIVSISTLSARRAELERTSEELAAAIEEGEDRLEYMTDDATRLEFFERYAREYLGYVYDGEESYVGAE